MTSTLLERGGKVRRKTKTRALDAAPRRSNQSTKAEPDIPDGPDRYAIPEGIDGAGNGDGIAGNGRGENCDGIAERGQFRTENVVHREGTL